MSHRYDSMGIMSEDHRDPRANFVGCICVLLFLLLLESCTIAGYLQKILRVLEQQR